jgi:hypothetical protein
MTGPRCAVRVTVHGEQVDHHGWLTSEALREVIGYLADIPTEAPVVIDLGQLRALDMIFVRRLAEFPSANNVRFESADWRLAQKYALELINNLAPIEVRR